MKERLKIFINKGGGIPVSKALSTTVYVSNLLSFPSPLPPQSRPQAQTQSGTYRNANYICMYIIHYSWFSKNKPCNLLFDLKRLKNVYFWNNSNRFRTQIIKFEKTISFIIIIIIVIIIIIITKSSLSFTSMAFR